MNPGQNYPKTILAIIVFTLLLACPLIVFGESYKSYKMTGKISAIDLTHQTITIEVPLAAQMFTVAGPLAADARLTKANKPATLKDYNVGERVTVIFHSNDQGHVIDRLIG
jgi:hypothetical protein